ncbi:MAG TPA: hypothetical protein VJ888_10150 [Mobilitalea sp.]|nr:hypothetical protein [Mobilitalea sp.]
MMIIFSGIGVVLITLLKWSGMIILGALRLILELAKIILLTFGLIARVFLAFARAGTP